jgi:hypothetical protein
MDGTWMGGSPTWFSFALSFPFLFVSLFRFVHKELTSLIHHNNTTASSINLQPPTIIVPDTNWL